MVILIVFVVIVAVVLALYFLGLLPGTGPYIIRRYNLSALEGIEKKDLRAKCKALKKVNMAKIEKEIEGDDRFFTFTGFKTIRGLVSDFPELIETCSMMNKGYVLDEDEFAQAIRSSGLEAAAATWKSGTLCNDAIRGTTWDRSIEGVITSDEEIISTDVFMKDKYPTVYEFITKC